MTPPIAVALDTAELDRAAQVAVAVAPYVSTVKVGVELFSAHGPAAVRRLREVAPGLAVMLDLKLHDIPNTVAKAAHALRPLQPEILTVHALGGPAMIAAAAEVLPHTAVAAVTVLTSHPPEELPRLGLSGPVGEAVLRLARLAVDAGATAIVCSPQEVAAVRESVGPQVRLITPGVRPAGADPGDQARTATPAATLAAGADLLVIGRPILAAPDPAAAAAGIAASLHADTHR